MFIQDAESACKQAQLVLADVKAARGKQLEIENRMAEKRRIPVSEHSQMHDQMRAALFDTQKDVEVNKIEGYLSIINLVTSGELRLSYLLFSLGCLLF